jgi:hypothetical protein
VRVVTRRSMFVLMPFLAVGRAANAQDLLTVSGAVTTRAEGMAVPGAVVSVVGTDRSATTDAGRRCTEQVPHGVVRGSRIQLKVDALGLPTKMIDVAVDGTTITTDVALRLEISGQVTVGAVASSVAEKAAPVDLITHELIASSGYAATAQNLFDVFPDRNCTVNSFNRIHTFRRSQSPLGMNGRTIHARIGRKF